MGKIITYIIYFLVAVAIYVLIRAAFTGSINSNTTIGEAATEVKDGSVQTLKEIKNDASSAIDNLKNKAAVRLCRFGRPGCRFFVFRFRPKKRAVPYRSLLFLCQFTLSITLKLHNQTADKPAKLNQLYQMQNPNRRINRFV